VTPIEPDEVQPGLVAFLNVDVLAADDRVVNTKDPRRGIRAGPFICLSARDEVSQWTQITTEERQERVEIRPDWRRGGHPQWLRDPQYLQDGANVWRGPLEVFVAASHEELTDQTTRAWVTEEGLRAIVEEVVAQRRRRDRD
jgi:hypothetical protein